ncbi:Copia protein [Vitis vinifera]|uniref:Copia protein n=1 Tax=Vitis vinifera TaxID=29760 RepID=A0A438I949_VITVI|nr:Copia protein [Vitis vinifera]
MQGKNNGERKNRVKKIEDGSCSLLLHFWSNSRSPFSTCYIPFQSSGSQESNALNGVRFGVETKELQPLQADHSKLKEDFCTAAKSAFCCKNFAAILHSARLSGACSQGIIQTNFEDFSSEDERLGFSSLGVRKVVPTLGKASDLHPWRFTSLSLASLWEVKDHLEWQVLGERYEPLQGASVRGIYYLNPLMGSICTTPVINFVDYSLNQGAPAGHESTETPIGHESNLGLCEALWLRLLLQDLSYLSRQPIRLFYDNKVACDIAHNPVQHDRTKHVEVDRFFIKEKLDDKILELPKIRLEDQLADILTKAVSSQVFSKFLDKLGMCDIYAPT